MSSGQPDTRFTRLARSLARFVVAWRTACLLAIAAVTVGFGYAISERLQVNSSSEALFSSNSEVANALREMRKQFGRDDMVLVLVEGPVFSVEFLNRLRTMHRALETLTAPAPSAKAPEARTEAAVALEGFDGDSGWGDEAGGSVVEEVTSLINVRKARYEDARLVVDGLLEEPPAPGMISALADRVLSDPNLVGYVVDRVGRHALVSVRTSLMSDEESDAFCHRVRELTVKHDRPEFRIQLAGYPVLNASMNAIMQDDAALMFAVCLLIMIVVLTCTYRNRWAVIGPVFVVVLAVVWTLGAMALSDVPVTLVTNILPAFLICVGIGDSIHILTLYRRARIAGQNAAAAIEETLERTAIPVVLTSVTTIIGLGSFGVAGIDAIRDMGIFGGLGVGFALFHSVLTLPAILTFERRGFGSSSTDVDSWIVRMCDGLLRRSEAASRPTRTGYARAWRVVMLAVLLAAGGGLATMRIDTSHDPLRWLPKGDETRAAFETLDETVGGGAAIGLLIQARGDGVLARSDVFTGLERLEAHIAKYRTEAGKALVAKIVSPLDLIRETWRALRPDDPTHRLPPDTRALSDTLTLLESSAAKELASLFTIDRRFALMSVRVPFMDSAAYEPVTHHIENGVARHVASVARVDVTGTAYNEFMITLQMQRDLIASLGLSVVIIFLVMFAMLREFKLTMIAMLPNFLPLLLLLGIMGLLEIPLDVSNLLLGSIMLGIAVDDTIHFLHHFKARRDLDGNVEAAIGDAFAWAGRAMVGTSMILFAGFSVFSFATLKNVQLFGQLIALLVALALACDLLLLPALLRVAYRRSAVPRVIAERAHADPEGECL
jgi:uncharacterized protein